MTKYRVSEISARSPDMADADLNALVDDIRAHGQLVPIWVRGDEVIDGRKRLSACARLGIEPIVVNLTPDQNPSSLSRSLNILRTHYTTSQRAMMAARLVTATRQTGPARRRGELKSDQGHQATTAAEAAAEAAVNRSTVQAAKTVRAKAIPEVTAAVEAGSINLNSAKKLMDLPLEKQLEGLERIMAGANKGISRRAAPGLLDPKKRGLLKKTGRPASDQIEAALDKLEFSATHIINIIDGVEIRDDWAKRLRTVRRQISQIIGLVEGQ